MDPQVWGLGLWVYREVGCRDVRMGLDVRAWYGGLKENGHQMGWRY